MNKVSKKEKIDRLTKALLHKEGDRVPVGEFFWTGFTQKCKEKWGNDFDPYRHWDLDLIVINPNMDPHIKNIEVLEKSDDHIIVKTGFEATIERKKSCPMPYYADFDTKSVDLLEEFVFDNPLDNRRYLDAIDDQINSVTDILTFGLPSFVDRVNSYVDDFCVFGGVNEPHEMIWRIMGTDNVLLNLAAEPDRMAKCIERIGNFCVGIVKGQIAAAKDKLSGIYIWGDVAYDNGMFFSPDFWRKVYKPQLKRICDAVHEAGLKTIYHGCGNASVLFDDMIEAGVDCYNPLEVKAGLDVLELKRKYGKRWSFNGNIDIRVLATNNRDEIRQEVLTKLNAAKGGGYIVQTDHSVASNVEPESYDYLIQLVREYSQYPLHLGQYDLKI